MEFSRAYDNFKCLYKKVWKLIVCTSFSISVDSVLFLNSSATQFYPTLRLQRFVMLYIVMRNILSF